MRWTGVHEGLVQLEARHRQQPAGRVGASTDARLAIHELRSHHQLFTFEVELVGTRGRLDGADGRVDVLGRPTDVAPAVAFGQTLKPGVYAFPDGLRLRVEQMTACDFDVSDPCTFGGHYRAYAALGEREDHVEIKSSQTPLLGHVLEFRRRAFVVRK